MMDCNSNPKLVLNNVDVEAIADTGTTGNYLTLNSPCDNKQKSSTPISIACQMAKYFNQITQHFLKRSYYLSKLKKLIFFQD